MQMVLVWSWNEPRMVLMFKLWMMATIRSWCTKSIVDLIEQWFLSLCEPCCDQNIQPDVFSMVSWASWSVEPCLSSLLKPYGYTSFGLGSFRFVVFLSRAGSLNSSPNLFKLYQFFWKTKEEMADRQMSPFYLFLTLSYFWTAKLSLLSKMEAQKHDIVISDPIMTKSWFFLSNSFRSFCFEKPKRRRFREFVLQILPRYKNLFIQLLFLTISSRLVSSTSVFFKPDFDGYHNNSNNLQQVFLTSFQKKFSQNSDLMTCNVEYSFCAKP